MYALQGFLLNDNGKKIMHVHLSKTIQTATIYHLAGYFQKVF